MVNTTSIAGIEIAQSALDPRRRAWGILLLAFATFCATCLFSGIGLNYFFFQSTVPLDATVQVGRGSGGVSGQVVYTERSLSTGDVLRSDKISQSTLFFRDSQYDNRLVAAVTIWRDTSINLTQTIRPRFAWTGGGYGIVLGDFTGEIDVYVPQDLSRVLQFRIITIQGDVVDLSASGQYSLRVSDESTRVINRSGFASITPTNGHLGRIVPPNNQATVLYSVNPQEVVVSESNINLLTNSTFEETSVRSSDSTGQSETLFVQDWACVDRSSPAGSFTPELKDGRMVLRLVRDDNASTHGDTGCIRYLGADALDVTPYSYLSLRATFNLQYQSLSFCGVEASECPLMLRVQYYDEAGGKRDWYHGFYYLVKPEDNYRIQCDSCLQEHEAINEKAWYTYDSGNLLDSIPQDQRPAKILNVQFYASGHQYDVYVGEVAMMAGAFAPLTETGINP